MYLVSPVYDIKHSLLFADGTLSISNRSYYDCRENTALNIIANPRLSIFLLLLFFYCVVLLHA